MADSKLVRKSIPLVSPEFTSLRDNIRTYLEAQPELLDYNFDGSVLSTVLDILAHDSYFQTFYANMLANEAFLSTAARRGSVVEHAKKLGYTPRGRTGATAQVTLDFTATSPVSALNIERGDELVSATVLGKTYSFRAEDDIIIDEDAGNYIATVTLKEGRHEEETFFWLTTSEKDGFVLADPDLDPATIRVKVKESSSGNNTYEYTRFTNLLETDGDSRIFFLEEVEGGLWKVVFGNNVLGKQPVLEDEITVDYFVTSGPKANAIKTFKYSGNVTDTSGATVTTVVQSGGGRERESISSIKFLAPKAWEAQNRAVTAADYAVIVRREVTNIEDVSVWGGEDNDPPQFGYVYLSIKPQSPALTLTFEEKADIESILSKYNVVSILPKIVDPDYLFANITGTVYYDPSLTDKTKTEMATHAKDVIVNYVDEELEKFNRHLRYSVVTRTVDASDPGILSTDLNIEVEKRFFPTYNVLSSYNMNFGGAVEADSISSTTFEFEGFSGCRLISNSAGRVDVVRTVDNTTVTVQSNVGVFDPSLGTLSLTINVTDVPNIPSLYMNGLRFVGVRAKPVNKDVRTVRNQIVTIDSNNVTITAVDEST